MYTEVDGSKSLLSSSDARVPHPPHPPPPPPPPQYVTIYHFPPTHLNPYRRVSFSYNNSIPAHQLLFLWSGPPTNVYF